MAIQKYGTEPAKVEVKEEDNDPATLTAVKKEAQESSGEPKREDDWNPKAAWL